MKYFYTDLIDIESIFTSLDEMDLSKDERLHLAHLVDSSLHHTILNEILSHLSDSDKRVFMQYLNERSSSSSEQDHGKIWKFLNEKIEGVEDKIKKAAEGLKEELHKDLKEARQRRG